MHLLVSLLLAALLEPRAMAHVIVLDPGHEPSRGGATASCQKREYQYNDEIAAAVRTALRGESTLLTRAPGLEVEVGTAGLLGFVDEADRSSWDEKKTLLARTALANRARADLFISFHSDSVADKDLVFDPALCGGRGGMRVRDEFKRAHRMGYDVFVSDRSPEPLRSRSLAFARAVGRRMRGLGRTAADYHSPAIDGCHSCRAIDPELGVYNEDLAVLRTATMPAVLIEVGNILDPEDERVISSPEFRRSFAEAIADAVAEYFAAPDSRGAGELGQAASEPRRGRLPAATPKR